MGRREPQAPPMGAIDKNDVLVKKGVLVNSDMRVTVGCNIRPQRRRCQALPWASLISWATMANSSKHNEFPHLGRVRSAVPADLADR